MTMGHLWKTQGWVEREDGDAVWSLEARPGQGQMWVDVFPQWRGSKSGGACW